MARQNLPTDLLYHKLMVGNWQWGINTDLNWTEILPCNPSPPVVSRPLGHHNSDAFAMLRLAANLFLGKAQSSDPGSGVNQP